MCWINDNNYNKVVIFSDSLSSLVSLKSKYSQSRPEILMEILIIYKRCLNAGKQVTLVWCPAHIGISGNEKADRAAKAGLNLSDITEPIPLSPTELYSIIKIYIKNKWQTKLNLANQHKHVRDSVGLSRPLNYSINQRIDRAITRLRLGTTLLPGSKGQYIKGLDPLCPQCRVKFDSDHLLIDCTQFTNERNNLIKVCQSAGLGFSISNVLNPPKNVHKTIFKGLEMFLLNCNLTDKI